MPPANFCKAKKPFGLGYDPEVIDRIRTEERDITVAQLAAEAEPLKPHGRPAKEDENKGENITFKRGTDPDYLQHEATKREKQSGNSPIPSQANRGKKENGVSTCGLPISSSSQRAQERFVQGNRSDTGNQMRRPADAYEERRRLLYRQ